jgi:predicted peptidase
MRFAALVPICGGGDPEKAKLIADVPIWVFHGKKDSVVPFSNSEKMVEALKKRGGDPKFTAYSDADHDSWTETYNNPELYEWLLKQKRKSEPANP